MIDPETPANRPVMIEPKTPGKPPAELKTPEKSSVTTGRKSPSLVEPKTQPISPALAEPNTPGRNPALPEPNTPGRNPALPEPKSPEKPPVLTEGKTSGKPPALTKPMRPAKAQAVTLAQVPLLWLVGVFTVLHPIMVTAPKFGRPASTETFPYIAGLLDEKAEISYVPFCTGTILTAEYVLTTYGCIKRPGRGKRRRDNIGAKDIVLIFGTAYSPPTQNIDGKLTPNLVRYASGRGASFVFPTEEDLEDAYAGYPNIAEIKTSNNEYEVENSYGKKYTRYYIDFAAIKLEKKIVWTDNVVPAIYPLAGKTLTRSWWKKKVFNYKSGVHFMDPCYMVGWGGWDEKPNKQMRLRYTQVKHVPYALCQLSYCTQCAYCNKSWTIDWEQQACYKSLLYADACLEDEGAPVWCPWAGITTTRHGEDYETGAVLGLLSYAASCNKKSVPSVYSNTWQAFSMISRAVGYDFPPNVVVFEDILEDPLEDRIRERNQRLIDQIKQDLDEIAKAEQKKKEKEEYYYSYFG